MTPSGESDSTPERWNSGDIAAIRGEALDALSDALLWRLAEARWQAIERILVAMDAAVARGDMDALAAATADLELAGPLRIIPIGPPPVGPPPTVRDLLNELVHALGDEAPGEPGDAGADDAGTTGS